MPVFPELTPMLIAMLVGSGLIAGFMNVMSAGGSMVTLPMLMFLGLDPTTANGSNRVSIVLQNTTAVSQYIRAGRGQLALGLRLGVPAIIGALIGAWSATLISDAAFRVILIVVMLGCCTMMLWPQKTVSETHTLSAHEINPKVWFAMLLIGFYGGFIQVGVGILFIVVLYRLLKIDLVQTNILKVLIVLLYMIPALGVFALKGHVAWGHGLALAGGSILGATLGTRLTLSPSGQRWIKMLTLLVILIMLVKLGIDGFAHESAAAH